jgi:hypothetical protein
VYLFPLKTTVEVQNLVSQGSPRQHAYRNTARMDKLEDAENRSCGSYTKLKEIRIVNVMESYCRTNPNYRAVLIYRPQGNSVTALSTCASNTRARAHTHSGRQCLSWISHEQAGILHRVENSFKQPSHKRLLNRSSIRVLYPDGVIHLQEQHTIHESRVVRESLTR